MYGRRVGGCMGGGWVNVWEEGGWLYGRRVDGCMGGWVDVWEEGG